MKRFKSSSHLLQILKRRVHLEGVGELLGTHGANAVGVEAAMELGVGMLSVATDDFWAKVGICIEAPAHSSFFRAVLVLSISQMAIRPSILPSSQMPLSARLPREGGDIVRGY